MRKQRYPFARSKRWRWVRLLDAVLDPFAVYTHRVAPPPATQVRNILVIRLDQIGDLICALPVFPVLKAAFPNAKITVLVGVEGQAVFAGNPFVDALIVFSPNWFSRKKHGLLRASLRTGFAIRRKQFDMGFDLRGDVRNVLLMTLAGVRYRVGYDIAGGRGLLHHVGQYDKTLHQTTLNLALVRGGRTEACDEPRPALYLSPAERADAQARLRRLGVQAADEAIVIHPEAGYPSKEWGWASFKGLIQSLLSSQPRFKILIVGLTHAPPLVEAFFGHPRVIDLTGALSLRELIAILSCCRLCIGNDSGPSHIAQALGIPLVVLASGTNVYERWGIRWKPSRVLQHAVPCAPCHLSQCRVAGHPCMAGISVDAVLEAIRAVRNGVTT